MEVGVDPLCLRLQLRSELSSDCSFLRFFAASVDEEEIEVGEETTAMVVAAMITAGASEADSEAVLDGLSEAGEADEEDEAEEVDEAEEAEEAGEADEQVVAIAVDEVSAADGSGVSVVEEDEASVADEDVEVGTLCRTNKSIIGRILASKKLLTSSITNPESTKIAPISASTRSHGILPLTSL